MTFLSNPLNRVLALLALALVIGLLAYFWLVQPTMAQYSASDARLTQDNTTYDDLKRVADQKPVYIALTKQIQSRLTGVELTADPRVYIPSYLKQIEDLAKRDGLAVTSVTPQVVATPSPTPAAAAGTPQQAANAVPLANNAVKAFGNSNVPSTPTPAPMQSMPAGASPAASGGAKPTGAVGAPLKTTPRANAIAYLNQSFTQVPINMELAGTYAQLEQFLRDLNKFPKLIGVGNVTMSPGSHTGVGETPTLSIVLPIIAYRLSPSGAAAAAPTPTPAAGNGG